jgi:hypothetical protein
MTKETGVQLFWHERLTKRVALGECNWQAEKSAISTCQATFRYEPQLNEHCVETLSGFGANAACPLDGALVALCLAEQNGRERVQLVPQRRFTFCQRLCHWMCPTFTLPSLRTRCFARQLDPSQQMLGLRAQ